MWFLNVHLSNIDRRGISTSNWDRKRRRIVKEERIVLKVPQKEFKQLIEGLNRVQLHNKKRRKRQKERGRISREKNIFLIREDHNESCRHYKQLVWRTESSRTSCSIMVWSTSTSRTAAKWSSRSDQRSRTAATATTASITSSTTTSTYTSTPIIPAASTDSSQGYEMVIF